MILNFKEYVAENMGAVTMERKPADKLNNPDFMTPNPNTIDIRGTSSAIPSHWGGASSIALGNYNTGMFSFGSNPKDGAMKFGEFVETSKKFQNNSK